MNNFEIIDIIEKYCNNNSITLTKLSANYILKLTKGSNIRYIFNYRFDVNSSATLLICNDKAGTSTVLNSFNISNVHHELFLTPNNDTNTLKKITDFFYKHKKIVCKVNDGSGGKDVYFVDNIKDLKIAVNNILKKDKFIALCPFFDIKNEYRVIILNDTVKLIYLKERPYIIGNGKSIISELIDKKNINLENIPLNRVLKENEKYYLTLKHNLKYGAVPKIVDTTSALFNEISILAKKAARAINGKFICVDIIDTFEGLKVLEINASVKLKNFMNSSLENYKITEKIYTDVLDLMFLNERKDNKWKY